MKKLRKTLALVLAVVMLISVIPFTVNAEEPSATFTVAKVNGTDYDGSTPIVGGDSVAVNINISLEEGEIFKGWMLGYHFDSAALTYTGTEYDNTVWNLTTADKTSYVLVGATIKPGQSVSGLEQTVATINFTVNAAFTGTTTIEGGMGTRNYISIMEDGSSTAKSKNITSQGCDITVYEQVDKTALKAQLDAYALLDEEDYTPKSWSGLPALVTAGQAVYDNAFATQTQIDDAAAAIAEAIAGLVPLGNKFALQTAVNNGRIEAAKDCYTQASVNNLLAVIETAQVVLDDDNATQAEIDAQTALVNAAIDALVLNNVTVRFLNYDGSVFDEQSVAYGGNATVPATNPTKPSDAENDYVFESWQGTYTNVTADVDITPVFTSTKIEYTITFVDEDGTELATQTYNYGDTITPPENPTKAEDDTYTYAFNAWTPALDTVSGNATYTATYTATYKEYTIRFVNEDDSEIATYTLHWGDEVSAPAAPEKAADETYTYEFAGWDKEVVAVAGDATYKAIFNPVYIDYTIQFFNENGTLIDTQTLHYGDTVTLPENPTKEADDTYTYEFSGWAPEVTAVTGDAIYMATYNNVYKEYKVTFVNYDGTEIASYNLHWGDTVTAPAENPTKPEDDTYTYTFAGWDPEIDVVAGEVTYTAQYNAVYKEYTIKFVNYDDSEVATLTLHWGDEVTAPAAPSKPADDQYTYVFAGWDPAVVNVAGDATYKATFTETTNTYTVTFLNDDGSEFATAQYEYGATPVAPEGTPVKDNDDMHYYVFSGWAPEFAPVTGAATYTAQFNAFFLDADYTAVNAAVDKAMTYQDSDKYTSVSYNRLFAAVAAVDYTLTIDKQAEVDAYAAAILDAIDKLVSTTEYDAAYTKCAEVNNDNGQYTVDSYNAFKAAFEAIGAKKDFNTEEATQAQVNEAKAALDAAYALLEATNLGIDGAEDYLENDEIRIKSNTNTNTTSLVANDGGAGTASLKFTDAKGAVIIDATKSLGTGTKVELMQGDEAKVTKYIIVYGDINGDGQVSIADIRLARKMAVSTNGYTAYQIAAAKCGGADVDVEKVIALASAI